VFICSKNAAGFIWCTRRGVDTTRTAGAFVLVVGVLVVVTCEITFFSSSESCSAFIGFVHQTKQTHSSELMKHLIYDKVKLIENNSEAKFVSFFVPFSRTLLIINRVKFGLK